MKKVFKSISNSSKMVFSIIVKAIKSMFNGGKNNYTSIKIGDTYQDKRKQINRNNSNLTIIIIVAMFLFYLYISS